MPAFRRGLVNYVAPPCYALTGGGQPWGHTPIPILLDALAVQWTDVSFAEAMTFQLGIATEPVGPELYIEHGGVGRAELDEPLLVPAVDDGNIDDDSLFGIIMGRRDVSDFAFAQISYQPSRAADIGKAVMGIGSTTLAVQPAANGLYGPVSYQQGWPGAWNVGLGDIFACERELSDFPTRPSGEVQAIAAVPWCAPSTFQDFMLVVRDVGGPDGVYTFRFRVNGETVLTIGPTSASSQRIWLPDVESIEVRVGDRVNWLCECSGGASLDGELLWTTRVDPRVGRDPGWMADPPGAFGGPYQG